jgi:hypothetical protein
MGWRITILFVFIAFASCKSTKVSEGKVDELPARVVVKKNKEVTFAPTSLKASMSVRYKSDNESTSLNASLRMIKDSIIWLSFSKLGFPLAKLKITPYEVQFYEKIGKSYFKGDFDLISEWMDAEFDFEKIQNLILGNPIIKLEKNKHVANVYDNKYQLLPKKRNTIFDIKYLIDPVTFKILEEELNHLEKKQNIRVFYGNFDRINEYLLPKEFRLLVKGVNQTTQVEANYKNVQLDVPLKFPFTIPEGYKNIVLK